MRLHKVITFCLVGWLILCCGESMAQRRVIKVEGGRRQTVLRSDTLRIDSLKLDSLRLDSIKMDSIHHIEKLRVDSIIMDSLKIDAIKLDSLRLCGDSVWIDASGKKRIVDTTFLRRGPLIDTTAKKADSVVQRSARELRALKRELDKHSFAFTRDTMPAGAHLAMSLVPGLGQIYNRQWWKTPVIYAGIGAFITAGIITSNQYNQYKSDWQRAVNLNMPREVADPLQRKMTQAGSTRTIMYSLAALTYLYQIADATFNYRGTSNPVRKATTLAAVFPGAGFIYTKTYWRIPIYYGGFIVLGTVIDYNNRNYQRYKAAYNALTDGDPTTTDEFKGYYSPEILRSVRDGYRRDRDFGIICLAGAYILSVVDTYVIATLKNWDVSPDLSVVVEPTIFDNSMMRASAPNDGLPQGAGLSLKLKF
ncbi:MAG: DUF5683 domain-containing protein [Mucinivorans sp.]